MTLVEAEPVTGRTHQIRVHAAEAGFPILGDGLYGGTRSDRLYLHAAEITLLKDFLRRRVAWIRTQLDTNF